MNKETLNRKDLLKFSSLSIVNPLIKRLQFTERFIPDHKPAVETLEKSTIVLITLKAGQILIGNSQKLEIGGQLLSCNPEQNPLKTMAFAVGAKDDVTVELGIPDKVASWMAVVETPNQGWDFVSDVDVARRIQGTRSFLPGQCGSPDGCSKGVKLVGFVALNRGGTVYESLGEEEIGPQGQADLPPYMKYYGESARTIIGGTSSEVPEAQPAPNQPVDQVVTKHFNPGESYTFEKDAFCAGDTQSSNFGHDNNPATGQIVNNLRGVKVEFPYGGDCAIYGNNSYGNEALNQWITNMKRSGCINGCSEVIVINGQNGQRIR